jgi:hypothetical protein
VVQAGLRGAERGSLRRRRLIEVSGAGLAVTFAVVGILFLVVPGDVLAAFNRLARELGWPESPTAAFTLYLALAAAYMYVVTVLAVQMARHPEERVYPWLLAQAKAASALLSLGLFALQEPYVIYLANFLVDGAIAVFVWWLCLSGRAVEEAPPAR